MAHESPGELYAKLEAVERRERDLGLENRRLRSLVRSLEAEVAWRDVELAKRRAA
jgi:hypothetical protein